MKSENGERIWIAPARLAAHDFQASLRKIKRFGYSDRDVLERLHEQRKAAIKSMSLMIFGALVIFFATPAGSGETAFSVQTPYFSIHFPKLILVFLTSILWAFGLFASTSAAMLDRYLIVVKRRNLGNSPWHMADRLFDGDSAWIDPVLVSWRFFESGSTQSFVTNISLVVIFVPILLLGGVLAFETVAFCWLEVSGDWERATDTAIAISSILLVVFPVVYRVLIMVPFPVKKNRSFVRWNFLTGIWREKYRIHPMAENWTSR